jgi:hypothetical protein
MNERIKKLAARAGVTEVQGLLCAFAYQGAIKADFLEKFAELIVGECAELCSTHEMADEPFGEKSYRKGHHFDVMIRQHFGVE